MAEWIVEAGIGETRAALIEDGGIIEARIEREGLRAGSVLMARLSAALPETGRARVKLPDGSEGLLRPIPRASEGAAVRVAVVREAIPEPGRLKPALLRLARDDEAEGDAPPLAERLAAGGGRVRMLGAHGPDALDAAGWSELLDEAGGAPIVFPGGMLTLFLTPAMSLFDVDGGLAPDALAVAGAAAAARAIRRLDIGGSIGIDLPTVAKPARAAAAAAFDAVLPQPFERTAVNGFGFLQVVRPRVRASLAETVRGDPVTAAALALLRRAQRDPGRGRRTLAAAPAVARRVARETGWRDALARSLGAEIGLREDASLAISGGHVEPATSQA